MKAHRMVAVLLCLSLLMCGCGKSSARTPYLSDTERASLEKRLFDSMELFVDPDSSSSAVLTFRNSSDYLLSNFALKKAGANGNVIFLDALPPKTGVQCGVYSSTESWDKIPPDQKFSMTYVIGEYSYESAEFPLTVTMTDNTSAIGDIKIYVKVGSGQQALSLNGKTSFDTGREINGLQDSRIYSMEGSISWWETENKFSSLSFIVEGKGPDGKKLVYKLKDENGVIRSSGDLSFYSGNEDTLYAFASLEPGIYYLEFEEIA